MSVWERAQKKLPGAQGAFGADPILFCVLEFFIGTQRFDDGPCGVLHDAEGNPFYAAALARRLDHGQNKKQDRPVRSEMLHDCMEYTERGFSFFEI